MNRRGHINSSFDWSCSYKFSCANAWRQCNKPFWRKFSCTQRGATAGVTLNWHFKKTQKVAKYFGYFQRKFRTRPYKIWSHWGQTRKFVDKTVQNLVTLGPNKKVCWRDRSKSSHTGTKQWSLLTRPFKIWSHWGQTGFYRTLKRNRIKVQI